MQAEVENTHDCRHEKISATLSSIIHCTDCLEVIE